MRLRVDVCGILAPSGPRRGRLPVAFSLFAMSTRALLLRRHSVLPGFNLALGFAVLYLCFIVLIPLSAVFLKTFTVSWGTFVATVTSPRVVASYRLTFGASFLAALVNAVFGLLVSWVLVRYRFPGKRL